jgi:hypothetical protein
MSSTPRLIRSIVFICAASRGLGAAARQRASTPASSNCAPPPNRIVAENCKPGRPSTQWDVNGSGDPRIQGFATDISVNIGETIMHLEDGNKSLDALRVSKSLDVFLELDPR